MGILGDIAILHRVAAVVMAEIFSRPPRMAVSDFRRQSLAFDILANRNVVDSAAVISGLKLTPDP